MGFVSGMLRPKASSQTLERLMTEYFGGGSTASGISVNSESAMRMMTVHNCIKVLYNCMSQLPCHLMERNGDIRRKAEDHPLHNVLYVKPNRWMTPSGFWGLIEVFVNTRGNFLAFKNKVRGEVRELLPIHPNRVMGIKQNSDWSLTYKISTADNWDGTKNGPAREHRDYSQDEIFHVMGMSLNGYSGLNPIEYARESIGLGMASEKFLSRYFGRGVHPSAVIRHPLALNSPTYSNLRKIFKEKYEGLSSEQNQGFMFLDEGMDITFPPIKLVDAQFLELGRFNEAQICGLFGVPLMLVQAGDNPTTFASAGEFKRTFVDMVIVPKVKNVEDSIIRDCVTDNDKGRFYPKFNLNALYRGNITERFKAYATGIEMKIINSNEARELEDLNPRDGGDVYENPRVTPALAKDGADNEPDEGIKQ